MVNLNNICLLFFCTVLVLIGGACEPQPKMVSYGSNEHGQLEFDGTSWDDEPLYEGEYTPIGKVIYGIEVLEKIKYLDKSEYVLRPDFINSLRLLVN